MILLSLSIAAIRYKCILACDTNTLSNNFNVVTPKDEYPMSVVEMLVDLVACFEYLSLLNGYSRYNQIFYYRGRSVENDILMP